MKIEDFGDLNEGPLDALKKAGKSIGNKAKTAGARFGNTVKGVAGATLAKSGGKATAAMGKRIANKAAATQAGTSKGQQAKKAKMADMMLDKWLEQANKVRSQESREPTADDLNLWLRGDGKDKKGFMGDKDLGEPYNDSTKDAAVKKYFSKLVDKFYQQRGSTSKAKATSNQAAGANKHWKKQDVKQKVAKAVSNPEVTSALTNLGWDGEKIKEKMAIAIDKGIDPKDTDALIKFLVPKKNESGPGISYITRTESLKESLMSKYLIEAARSARMEHIEDLVFNDGFDGAKAALTYIEQVVSMLANGSGQAAKITVKWDGAPGIVCGIDPEDGKFFVGTKSVFAKGEPKIVKSKRQLDKWYGDNPGLAKKLELALKYLPKLGIGNVLQGDFMFDHNDIMNAEIAGEKMIEFTPNTITYAVPAKSDLAATMQRAKIGIVFHTSYEGDSIAEMTPVYGVDVAGLNQSPDVWFDDATYKDLTGTASLTPKELAKIANTVKAIESTMKKIRPEKFNIVVDHKEFAKFVKPFINQMVRDGKLVTNPIAFLKDFLEFYKGKMQEEMDKIAAEKGEDHATIKNRLAKIKAKEEFIEDNSNALLGVLAVYKRLVEIKLLIINKLHQVEGLQTFIKDGDGYKVTNPEGFVAIGHHGDAVKLVDRLEFSKQNFNMVHGWQKK